MITRRVAVAGGTGVVGRHVVVVLQQAGHEADVLSRASGVDLTAPQGLAARLTGADAVLDLTNVGTLRRAVSVDFFTQVTRTLLDAGAQAGVRHHVALSIVGVDRVDAGYYAGKRAQEELVLAGPVPGSVLRATQFHEFAGQLLHRTPGPVAVVPRMRVQPVAAREVAEHLVQLALGEPQGPAPELAGPEVHGLADLARRTLAARGSRRRVLDLRLPGGAGRAMAEGGLLPTGDGPRGATTFDVWLASQR